MGLESGPVAQKVMSLIADSGITSLIQAQPHTFLELGHEIFSSHSPLSPDLGRAVVSYKRKYVF